MSSDCIRHSDIKMKVVVEAGMIRRVCKASTGFTFDTSQIMIMWDVLLCTRSMSRHQKSTHSPAKVQTHCTQYLNRLQVAWKSLHPSWVSFWTCLRYTHLHTCSGAFRMYYLMTVHVCQVDQLQPMLHRVSQQIRDLMRTYHVIKYCTLAVAVSTAFFDVKSLLLPTCSIFQQLPFLQVVLEQKLIDYTA